MTDSCKIYEEEGKKRIWLQDALEDNGIPYTIETEPYWTGGRIAKYCEKQCMYVETRYRDTVCGLINEYNNAENFILDEECGDCEEIPQITCARCEQSFDFDYPKCPFCNASC